MATDGRLLAIGYARDDDHDQVRIGGLTSGRARNIVRLAFGDPQMDVDVVDTFFTSEGLVAVSADYHEFQPVRLHFVPEPSARSPKIRLDVPDDAMAGHPTTLDGRLTFRGRPVADAAVVITDSGFGENADQPRTRAVRTDDQGRYSVAYIPRFGLEQYVARVARTPRHPAARLRIVREVDLPVSEVDLDVPDTVERGEPLVVRGIVTSEGRPVADMPVVVEELCHDGGVRRTTDAEGRFSTSFDSTGCDSIQIEAQAEGTSTVRWSLVVRATTQVVDPT